MNKTITKHKKFNPNERFLALARQKLISERRELGLQRTVGKDGVGLGNLAELLLGKGLSLVVVLVGVPLEGELPESILDLVVGAGPLKTKDVVVARFGHPARGANPGVDWGVRGTD